MGKLNMTPTELAELSIRQEINDLNESKSQPNADIHAINEKIRALQSQQTALQTEKLKSDFK